MALTKTVKKKTVKKTKSRKTSPSKKGEKLGRQQPKKNIVVKSKSEMRRIKIQAPEREVIMSETEAGFDDVGFDDLETEFDDTDYDREDEISAMENADKEY
jgi:hypothetical protein